MGLSMHICMIAFSDLHFDFRIFREATTLKEAGHRISIVAAAFNKAPLQGWDNFEIYLIPVDRSNSLRFSYPTFWRRAHQFLIFLGADAYHAHDLDTLWPAAGAAKRCNAPLIYDSHEFWTEQSSLALRPGIRAIWACMERYLIQKVDFTITVSASIAQSLQKRYSLDCVTVLRNLPPYRPPEKSNRIRSELNLDPDIPIVLYQGGFLTENGLREVIEAAADLNGVAFVLIGDGPCEAALKKQVIEAGLQQKIYFMPRVPFQELHSYTCSADLGLCVIKRTGESFFYSMPNKLFEYLMAGLPVLASNFPEMQSIIEKSGAGAVVDPLNISEIRRSIYDLLRDESQLKAYSHAALKAALRYNWEKEAGKLIQLYETL